MRRARINPQFVTYSEKDSVPLHDVRSQTIAIIGYGNQGQAQALCLRDSGVNVIVGNRNDNYRELAIRDGFTCFSIPAAVARASILFILTTDESQPSIWKEQILKHVAPGDTLVWASGYNVAFNLVEIPKGVDVIMIAPRMMGPAVRELFMIGSGAMAEIGVHQDASGHAKHTMLALCEAIGLLRGGCIASSMEGEATLDLFAEQVSIGKTARLDE